MTVVRGRVVMENGLWMRRGKGWGHLLETYIEKMRRKRDDSRFYTGRFEDFWLFLISQPASNDFGLYYAETGMTDGTK